MMACRVDSYVHKVFWMIWSFLLLCCDIVFVLEFGKWDYRKISSLSHEDVVNFHRHAEKLARSMIKAGQDHGGSVLIADMDNFSLSSYASHECKICCDFDFIGINWTLSLLLSEL